MSTNGPHGADSAEVGRLGRWPGWLVVAALSSSFLMGACSERKCEGVRPASLEIAYTIEGNVRSDAIAGVHVRAGFLSKGKRTKQLKPEGAGLIDRAGKLRMTFDGESAEELERESFDFEVRLVNQEGATLAGGAGQIDLSADGCNFASVALVGNEDGGTRWHPDGPSGDGASGDGGSDAGTREDGRVRDGSADGPPADGAQTDGAVDCNREAWPSVDLDVAPGKKVSLGDHVALEAAGSWVHVLLPFKTGSRPSVARISVPLGTRSQVATHVVEDLGERWGLLEPRAVALGSTEGGALALVMTRGVTGATDVVAQTGRVTADQATETLARLRGPPGADMRFVGLPAVAGSDRLTRDDAGDGPPRYVWLERNALSDGGVSGDVSLVSVAVVDDFQSWKNTRAPGVSVFGARVAASTGLWVLVPTSTSSTILLAHAAGGGTDAALSVTAGTGRYAWVFDGGSRYLLAYPSDSELVLQRVLCGSKCALEVEKPKRVPLADTLRLPAGRKLGFGSVFVYADAEPPQVAKPLETRLNLAFFDEALNEQAGAKLPTFTNGRVADLALAVAHDDGAAHVVVTALIHGSLGAADRLVLTGVTLPHACR